MRCDLVVVLPQALLFAIAAHACAGSTSDPTATMGEAGGDAAFESAYGGVFVVPSMRDGDTSTTGAGTVYGGPDVAASAPCPSDDAGPPSKDGGTEAGPLTDALEADGAADGACSAPLAQGDLVIDELMIASHSGTGDHGEWVEVMSTRDCTIDLNGLNAQISHGQGVTTATFASDVLLPPRAAFLIADSSDPTENNNLPGTIVTWGAGLSSDVLKNTGNTITLFTADVTVDALTYTATAKLVDGASMAFPSDCEPSLRTDFHNWQASLASWTPGFFGTPGAPNTDVSCAILTPPPPSGVLPCSKTLGRDE